MNDVLVPLIDTHAHLTNVRFNLDLSEVLARSATAGIATTISIGTGIDDAGAVAALVAAHPGRIAGAAGLDPFSCHEAGDAFADHLAQLDALLAGGGFVALGEIGLEYHHQVNPHPLQIEQFHAQLAMAERLDLPVVVHIRNAHADAMAVLREHPRNRGVIHSFSGGPAEAEVYVALGWHLSFNGTVTYKGNDLLRQAAAMCPADRLLIETDAPYLPPVPHRGRRNEPAHVRLIVAAVAEQRGMPVDDLAGWTTRNACWLFRLATPAGWEGLLR